MVIGGGKVGHDGLGWVMVQWVDHAGWDGSKLGHAGVEWGVS